MNDNRPSHHNSGRQPSACGWLGFLLALTFFGGLEAQPRSRQEEGVSLAVAGEYEKALTIFNDLLHDSPEDPLLNYYAGAACARLNRIAEAMGCLERAVRYQARFPQAYTELADLYLKKKLSGEARKVLEKGLKVFPRNQALLELQKKTRVPQ